MVHPRPRRNVTDPTEPEIWDMSTDGLTSAMSFSFREAQSGDRGEGLEEHRGDPRDGLLFYV